MSRRAMRGALPPGLVLLALLMLVVSACGGDGESVEDHPLPEKREDLRPRVYLSDEFEPSLSMHVGWDWSAASPEVFDDLRLVWRDAGALGIANLRGARFYEASKTGNPYAVDVPEDVVRWFRRHPYLRTGNPEPVSVGGVEGERFDVTVRGLPPHYSGMCGSSCVDVGRLSSGLLLALRTNHKVRVTFLSDVEDEKVMIVFGSQTGEFADFAPQAQRVIDTVKWEGS